MVVDSAGRGIHTGDFAEGGRHAHDDARNGEPAPDDVGRTAASKRVVHGGGETVRDGGEDERHEGYLQRGAVAGHLLRIAERGEELVGRGISGCLVRAALVGAAEDGLMVAEAGTSVLGDDDTRHGGMV